VFLPGPVLDAAVPADLQRESVRRLEAAGYRTAWSNEAVIDKDALVQVALMLANTERMVFGTSIANIWARAPQTMNVSAASLAEAYPGRFVLGIGVGYEFQANIVGQSWGNPMETIRQYFARMDEPPLMRQVPDAPYARILAARGPKMLALAAEIADGANPNAVPPEYTERARKVLGPDKLLVVGVSTVLDEDRDRGRATARQSVSGEFVVNMHLRNLAGLGFSEEEIRNGSDRLVDALTAHGEPTDIAAKLHEHLDAGADHVMVMLAGTDYAAGVDQLVRLAPALTAL
jgi:probable F420-dependent oxidoreductase